jgi:hypothetical protein
MRTLYESILDDIDTQMANGEQNVAEEVIYDIIHRDYRLKVERKNKLTIVGKTPDGKYLVNYTGDVEVKNKDLATLENELFQWNEVSGTFTCFKINKLKDLKGSPKNCAGFNCNQCKGLESLEGAPEKMTMGNSLTGNGFYCIECTNLKTLKGAPETAWGGFYCGYCTKLTSLEGAPKRIVGDFNCQDTGIKSIDHKFEAITGGFNCRNCVYLTSIEGVPNKIGGEFNCTNCKSLKSLKGLPSRIEGSLYLPKIDSLFDEIGADIISQTSVKGNPFVIPIK